jgi:hypothetical protein
MHQPTSSENTCRCYFVMNKSRDTWVRVSEEFKQKQEAEEALQRLRHSYPFARLGGDRSF